MLPTGRAAGWHGGDSRLLSHRAAAAAPPPSRASPGLADLSSVWQLQEWHNVSGVSSWNPPHVERVRGTDGMQFAPGLAVGDSVELWLGEIYRAIRLIAEEQARCCLAAAAVLLRLPLALPLLLLACLLARWAGPAAGALTGPRAPAFLPQIEESGVPLLRLRFDPKASAPDPTFFQYVRGLWNITSPTAGGRAQGRRQAGSRRARLLGGQPLAAARRGCRTVPGRRSGTRRLCALLQTPLLQAAPAVRPASPAPPSSSPARTTAAATRR